MQNKSTYRITLAILAVSILFAPLAGNAAEIYLDPDTVYIAGSIGDEFDLELRVDAATLDLKAYQITLGFDPTVLDTVSFTQGPLFPSVSLNTYFAYYLLNDDTIMQLEGLILGAGLSADGPGLLATVRVKTIASGKAEMNVINHGLRDVNNDPITSTASGAVFFVNYPPDPFGLVSPGDATEVHRYPMDSFELVWENTASVYAGENVTFTLDYGTSATFEPGSTTTLTGLTDTTHWLFADDLTDDTYYWRVTAIGDVNGYERIATPEPASFDFVLDNPNSSFNLLDPADSGLETKVLGEYVTFNWEASSSVYAGEGIDYTWELSTTAGFTSGTVTTVVLTGTTYDVAAVDLTEGPYYWRVTATGDIYGYERESNPFPATFTFQYGDIEPAAFNLIQPADGGIATALIGENVVFYWESSSSQNVGEGVDYFWELSSTATFDGGTVISAATGDTSYIVSVASLSEITYYWRVTATGDIYSYETQSTPFPASFDFELGVSEPSDFDLLSPADAELTEVGIPEFLTFSWESAQAGIPDDTIWYKLYIGPFGGFPGSAIIIDSVRDALSIGIATDSLPLAEWHNWRVEATNKFDVSKWSTSTNTAMFYGRGDLNSNHKENLGDITALIDAVYLSKVPPVPFETGDCNCDTKANLADITKLIDHVYVSKAELHCL